MHQHNIVHRDLKPENIMICNDGRVKIMDFGIAKATRHAPHYVHGLLGRDDGHPRLHGYRAGQRQSRGDARTDIYSLGAILYEMVTGQPPFEGTNPLAIMNARLMGDPVAPRKLNANISPQVEHHLHAMEQRPENRYPSASAMKADLDSPEKVALTGRADHLRPPAQWTGSWRPARASLFSHWCRSFLFGLLYVYFHFVACQHQ